MLSRRPATAADLPTMWELRTRAVRASCATHYPAAVIDIWCACAAPTSLPLLVLAGGAVVAEEDGQLVGYAVINLESGEIDAAFVEPSHQGRGIALQLLQGLESLAHQRRLARLFLSASLNAVPFYHRAGFVSLREEVCTAAGSASSRYSWKSCCAGHPESAVHARRMDHGAGAGLHSAFRPPHARHRCTALYPSWESRSPPS